MEELLLPLAIVLIALIISYLISKNEGSRKIFNIVFGVLTLIAVFGFVYAFVNLDKGWTGVAYGGLSYILILFVGPSYLFTLPWKKARSEDFKTENITQKLLFVIVPIILIGLLAVFFLLNFFSYKVWTVFS